MQLSARYNAVLELTEEIFKDKSPADGIINAYLRELGKQWEELPPHFVSSSEDRTGRVDILNYIENINKDLNVK